MVAHGDSREPGPHPRGLYSLFFTEMWERFCYYGMRAILVLYLIQYHGWQPSQASTVYKWYTSLVYLTPIVGGVLADRAIGLRTSIVAGGVLMAIGEFSLTFEPMWTFALGLGLLIAGNGFFKPNISTIVGKMYRAGDERRDGAFTIFYMGINLGAGLAPFVCGYLREHYGFRYGFAAAGLGMLVGLFVFTSTQRRVLRDVEAAGNDLKVARAASRQGRAGSEPNEQAQGADGVAGLVARGYPILMIVAGLAFPARYVWEASQARAGWTDVIMPLVFGATSCWMAVTLMRIRGAAKDKSIVIFVFFVFAVLFWMAFEQAGNALNLWAQFHTDLHVGGYAYPAEWWQSVNAVLIVLLAPVFARSWTWLADRRQEPSTAVKMLAAMGFMTLSFGVMVIGARVEDRTVTEEALASVPPQVPTQAGAAGQRIVGEGDAGRLRFDESRQVLQVRGVLPRYVVRALLDKTAPKDFREQVDALEGLTRRASEADPVRVLLATAPAGFLFPFDDEGARERGVEWDAARRTMSFTRWAETPTRADLVAGGAPPEWRDPLLSLEKKSEVARVSGVWLFLSYLFATLGELCLSPVGLSMVTKLAPVRFGSLFMGVWLLASSVAQYAGGSIGESWGIVPPTRYFALFVWTSIAGGAVLALLVRPVQRLMHEVH
ncbi:MAG TPA: peptide MFS transporter [Polyangiaceae bacterium]|nr:peptide MFS transporter [Polyangiaceae bacterium]